MMEGERDVNIWRRIEEWLDYFAHGFGFKLWDGDDDDMIRHHNHSIQLF